MSISLTHLKQFQNERLRGTYADFITREAYRPTCDFFFGRVYKGEDTSERDAAFVHFTDALEKVLGGDIITCMRELVDLQKLTNDLDERLLRMLHDMSGSEPLAMGIYEEAYYRCDNYAQRVDQIDLLLSSLHMANRIFHRWGIGPGLKALHRFQRLRGKTLVTGFLVEGYDALTGLKDVAPLARAIETRERERLDRIYRKTAG